MRYRIRRAAGSGAAAGLSVDRPVMRPNGVKQLENAWRDSPLAYRDRCYAPSWFDEVVRARAAAYVGNLTGVRVSGDTSPVAPSATSLRVRRDR